jgi:Protein of unknown function (DUF2971)
MNSHLENSDLPEILYHYTSQTGLKGMLNEKTIWASKIHYLNDSKEFALALELASDELDRRIKAATSQGDRSRLELLRDTIYTISRVNTCVCCFSELDDDLSQWRGYGGGNAGFSVGFTREWFTRVKETLGLSLSPCIYDPEKRQRLIQDEIDEFFATNTEKEPDYWDRNRGYVDPDRPRTFGVSRHAGNDFATRLALIAPLIKHKSFEAEREWRLVAATVPAHELHHRPGRSMLIPYYKIPIGDDDKFDSIREIVVGPTPHPDLSAASVESLAIAAGLVNPDNTLRTKTTRIPFRNW